jgi:hypothetical protein
VPAKYYFTNVAVDEMERILIGRGSSHKLKFDVAEVGSTLLWEFVSTDYDISFGVLLLHGEEKQEIVSFSVRRLT